MRYDAALNGKCDVSLRDLVEQFGLTQTFDLEFFQEWQAASADIAIADIQRLDQVKSNFTYLIQRPPFSEEAVKMVVLSPLLELAGFYRPPFWIKTEVSIEVVAEMRATLRSREKLMCLSCRRGFG